MNAIWGGEPLLRQDLSEIARSSGASGLVTTIITNGYYLGAGWASFRATWTAS